jgi:hypothetical protein
MAVGGRREGCARLEPEEGPQSRSDPVLIPGKNEEPVSGKRSPDWTGHEGYLPAAERNLRTETETGRCRQRGPYFGEVPPDPTCAIICKGQSFGQRCSARQGQRHGAVAPRNPQ